MKNNVFCFLIVAILVIMLAPTEGQALPGIQALSTMYMVPADFIENSSCVISASEISWDVSVSEKSVGMISSLPGDMEAAGNSFSDFNDRLSNLLIHLFTGGTLIGIAGIIRRTKVKPGEIWNVSPRMKVGTTYKNTLSAEI